MRFQGKIALVTGAARGIGEAIARAFASEGATVILTDIDGEEVEARARDLGQEGLHHDVASEADWVRIIGHVEKRHERLDILVANAGYGWLKPVTEIDIGEWRRLMAVNVDGVFLGMKHGIPLMERTGGSIVVMASAYSRIGAPRTAAYCASKGAVTLLAKAVALECAEKRNGIRVNSIHPGYVSTPSVASALSADQIAQLTAAHPIGRLADPREIARSVLFLASDDASFMTGAELPVDGGLTTA